VAAAVLQAAACEVRGQAAGVPTQQHCRQHSLAQAGRLSHVWQQCRPGHILQEAQHYRLISSSSFSTSTFTCTTNSSSSSSRPGSSFHYCPAALQQQQVQVIELAISLLYPSSSSSSSSSRPEQG